MDPRFKHVETAVVTAPPAMTKAQEAALRIRAAAEAEERARAEAAAAEQQRLLEEEAAREADAARIAQVLLWQSIFPGSLLVFTYAFCVCFPWKLGGRA